MNGHPNTMNHTCSELMIFNQKYTGTSEEDRVFVIKDAAKGTWDLYFRYPTKEHHQLELDSIDIPFCPFCGNDPNTFDPNIQTATRGLEQCILTYLDSTQLLETIEV